MKQIKSTYTTFKFIVEGHNGMWDLQSAITELHINADQAKDAFMKRFANRYKSAEVSGVFPNHQDDQAIMLIKQLA